MGRIDENLNCCTGCGVTLKLSCKSSFDIHPLLKTLLCTRCREQYGDGDYTKYEEGVDSEGDDNYCRWCADGGDLLVCCNEDCHYAYCEKCIKRNVGKKRYKKISESDDWPCFACNPEQIQKYIDHARKYFKTTEITVSMGDTTSGYGDIADEPTLDLTAETNEIDVTEIPKLKKEARARKSTARPAAALQENGHSQKLNGIAKSTEIEMASSEGSHDSDKEKAVEDQKTVDKVAAKRKSEINDLESEMKEFEVEPKRQKDEREDDTKGNSALESEMKEFELEPKRQKDEREDDTKVNSALESEMKEFKLEPKRQKDEREDDTKGNSAFKEVGESDDESTLDGGLLKTQLIELTEFKNATTEFCNCIENDGDLSEIQSKGQQVIGSALHLLFAVGSKK